MPTRGSKTDEEFVPLSQVNELLHQQKETFLVLLQQLSDTFRGFVRDIMDSNHQKENPQSLLCYRVKVIFKTI